MAVAGLGRISEKWPDSGFAGGGAEIRYNLTTNTKSPGQHSQLIAPAVKKLLVSDDYRPCFTPHLKVHLPNAQLNRHRNFDLVLMLQSTATLLRYNAVVLEIAVNGSRRAIVAEQHG